MSDPSIDASFVSRNVGRTDQVESRTSRSRPGQDADAAPRTPARGADRADLSPAARWLQQAAELPEIRADLVAAMRERIASGELDTPERFEAAFDAMLDEESRFPG